LLALVLAATASSSWLEEKMTAKGRTRLGPSQLEFEVAIAYISLGMLDGRGMQWHVHCPVHAPRT
jgi:hypothetical protein